MNDELIYSDDEAQAIIDRIGDALRDEVVNVLLALPPSIDVEVAISALRVALFMVAQAVSLAREE